MFTGAQAQALDAAQRQADMHGIALQKAMGAQGGAAAARARAEDIVEDSLLRGVLRQADFSKPVSIEEQAADAALREKGRIERAGDRPGGERPELIDKLLSSRETLAERQLSTLRMRARAVAGAPRDDFRSDVQPDRDDLAEAARRAAAAVEDGATNMFGTTAMGAAKKVAAVGAQIALHAADAVTAGGATKLKDAVAEFTKENPGVAWLAGSATVAAIWENPSAAKAVASAVASGLAGLGPAGVAGFLVPPIIAGALSVACDGDMVACADKAVKKTHDLMADAKAALNALPAPGDTAATTASTLRKHVLNAMGLSKWDKWTTDEKAGQVALFGRWLLSHLPHMPKHPDDEWMEQIHGIFHPEESPLALPPGGSSGKKKADEKGGGLPRRPDSPIPEDREAGAAMGRMAAFHILTGAMAGAGGSRRTGADEKDHPALLWGAGGGVQRAGGLAPPFTRAKTRAVLRAYFAERANPSYRKRGSKRKANAAVKAAVQEGGAWLKKELARLSRSKRKGGPPPPKRPKIS
jgi:hypothetical protein